MEHAKNAANLQLLLYYAVYKFIHQLCIYRPRRGWPRRNSV